MAFRVPLHQTRISLLSPAVPVATLRVHIWNLMIQGPKEAKLPRALFADENTGLVALLVFGDTGSQACFKTPFLVIFCLILLFL